MALSDQQQHLPFARRQLIESTVDVGIDGMITRAAKFSFKVALNQTSRHPRIQQCLASSDGMYSVKQPFGGSSFQQEATGTGPQCAPHVFVVLERGQDEDSGVRQ